MKKIISIFLLTAIFIFSSNFVYAENFSEIDTIAEDISKILYDTTPEPSIGSIHGEWAVIGLARSNFGIDANYAEKYYASVEKQVKEVSGILSSKKYTEYSRVIIALTAIGKNPENVGGYNLLTPLGDYEKTINQGVNGAIWALIALDSGNYSVPQNKNAKVQATRQKYIDYILNRQTSDGGWALSGDTANADVTAMALQALAKYIDNPKVKTAADNGIAVLSKMQNGDGGYSSFGTENSESTAQVLTALCELGISPNDSRFVKNSKSVIDSLISYYKKGSGFRHTNLDSECNQMATEQCFYAIAALQRFLGGKSSLYRINSADTFGLPNKNADIAKPTVKYQKKTFDDIQFHSNRIAIEKLASYGIVSGRTESRFEPSGTITRAEFSAIIVRALGLPLSGSCTFGDIFLRDWYCSYVGTAFSYGIIKGENAVVFNPNGTLTTAEASVIVMRTAELCGIDTALSQAEISSILSAFSDAGDIPQWAKNGIAFCIKEKILSAGSQIKPNEKALRADAAQMLYSTLVSAKLIEE